MKKTARKVHQLHVALLLCSVSSSLTVSERRITLNFISQTERLNRGCRDKCQEGPSEISVKRGLLKGRANCELEVRIVHTP